MTAGDDPMLDLRRVAARTGLAYETLVTYHARHRMPAPDDRFGGIPVWRASTIDSWNRARPAKRPPEHGTRSRYVQGCHCEDCRRANREYHRHRS
jgi:predicted DNA-binding transcriptional regulator AlpA